MRKARPFFVVISYVLYGIAVIGIIFGVISAVSIVFGPANQRVNNIAQTMVIFLSSAVQVMLAYGLRNISRSM